MVTGIRRWPSGLTRFLDANRYHPRIKSEGMLRPKALQIAPIATPRANP